MDFLKDLALPQSMSHISLMHFVLIMVFLILVPYLGILTGSSIYSFYFDFRSRKKSDKNDFRLAKEILDFPFMNLYLPIVFGIIPFFTIILIYAQLLQGTGSISIGLMFFAWLVFLISITLLYFYKQKLNLKFIFDSVESKSAEFKEFSDANFHSYKKFGIWGIILLLFSLFIISAGLFNSIAATNWENVTTIFHTFIQFEVWIKFILILTLLMVISGSAILYFIFYNNKEYKENFEKLAYREFFLKRTMIFILFLPLLIFVEVLILPKESLSIAVFSSVVLGILVLFLVAHFYYAMIKKSNSKFAAAVFYATIAIVCFLMIKEAYTLRNATAGESVKLAAHFQKYEDDLKSKLGINLVVLSGEDIFIGKCSACHKFDINFTGPAYNNVLPKYLENKGALIKFILNPTKIDPAFPPMPAQGLKPQEAESVTDYLLTTYKNQKK